ncbi:NACHT, LRR and PYD domains-containing protein 3-like isoform X1 [Hemicordylus capensis]|uniref:NACHT, LRR and PYD domains-containing protein 3-like isoform X1 n=1 Tax=Hemicordylus capensis TaxID=884348 RepID=UPI0023038953|nr:NACHT, LRR and PYD domains-containing protein 3-like isoform X1 [Hemicordylus capensis]
MLRVKTRILSLRSTTAPADSAACFCVIILDRRKKFRRHIQETFWGVPEMGFHPGPKVSFHQRYRELLLSRKPHLQQRAHELAAMERKHQEMEAHPEGCLPVGMENLFDSEAEGPNSRTVVLLGPAGVGKTTALQKLMLDWASGSLWQERFAYAFYISCGVVNRSREPMSLADLLLNSCSPGTLLMEDVLMNPDSLLLMVDGFDELNFSGLPGDKPSSDLHTKQAPAKLVIGLLRKKLLAKSHTIIATRPVALERLQQLCLISPQLVEVLGFRPTQRKEYFHQFFEDKAEATQAFELVRRNETLFSLCFLPVMCWMLCSSFREEPQRDLLQEIPETAKVTEIHMLLLSRFLGPHCRLSSLGGLCSLARHGVLHKTMVFDEEGLKEHGLDCLDLEAFSARGRILHQDAHLAATYRFTHLSFQEFFAALFYLIHADRESGMFLKDLKGGFGNKEHCSDYFMLVRFLFGLSNPQQLSVLQNTWDCRTSGAGLRQELLRWVEEGAQHHSFRRPEQLLELYHCVYEAEDLAFAQSVMGHIHSLDLQLSTKLDLMALSFCLPATAALHLFRLVGYELGTMGHSQLLPGLLKSSEIQLNRCGLTAAACESLASVVVSNQSLTRLDLGGNPLDDLGVSHLCEKLMDSCCQLQALRLHHCGLTAAVCKDLASVLETSETLVELGLGDNQLGDEGVRQLCPALRKPHCKLQRLALTMHGLNATTKKKLHAARAARPQIILISYYPPSFLAFPGGDE